MRIEDSNGAQFNNLVELLIANGGDVNKPDENGRTPFHLAAQRYDKASSIGLKVLCSHHANPRVLNNFGQLTDFIESAPPDFVRAVSAFSNRYDPGYESKIQQLKDEYTAEKKREHDAGKLLTALITNNAEKMAKYLNRKNINPDSPLVHGAIPSQRASLWYSVSLGRDNLIDLLLKANANFRIKTSLASGYELNLLELASTPKGIRMLIAAGLDLNKPNGNSNPLILSDIPWHNMMLFGQPQVAECLLEIGVDLGMKSSQGFTIQQLLEPHKNPSAREFLERTQKACVEAKAAIQAQLEKEARGLDLDFCRAIIKAAAIYSKYEGSFLAELANEQDEKLLRSELQQMIDTIPAEMSWKQSMVNFMEIPFVYQLMAPGCRLVTMLVDDVDDLLKGGNMNQKAIAAMIARP